MANGPLWSRREIEILESYVYERDWLPKVKAHMDRGDQALRCKMAKLRAAKGLSDPRCSKNTWMRNAASGSARLAAAITGEMPPQPTRRLWCRQCDKMVDDVQAAACGSRWCKAKDEAG